MDIFFITPHLSQLRNLLEDLGYDEDSDSSHHPKTLIFTSTKATCDFIADGLKADGFNKCEAMHGDKEQALRTVRKSCSSTPRPRRYD